MMSVTKHNKIWKGILLTLFVLFSLSPCPAKQSLLQKFDLELGINANKTKATGSLINACGFIKQATAKASATASLAKIVPHHLCDHHTSERYQSGVIAVSVNSSASVKTGGNPPRYILFKRLKSYLA